MSVDVTSLHDRMVAIKVALEGMYPDRVITRALKDIGDYAPADQEKGVYTLVSKGESGYKNYNGMEAAYGKHAILLVGQMRLSEEADGEDVEDAEFDMVTEIKAFLREVPPEVCCLEAQGFVQSMQLTVPYAFIAFDLVIDE